MRNIFTGLFVFLLAIALAGCDNSADEQIILGNIQAMREAIQNHDRNTFMQHVAPNYRGQDHGNRPVLERFVIEQLKKNKNIYIYMADTSIEIKDGIAQVIFYAGTAGGPDQVPERGQLYKVMTNWKPFGDHWQLIHARWRPALSGN